MYYATSASDLTYQSGEFVYIPEQYVGEDSDGDGIPDLVELYGLKPNGDPINTNPYSKDTDGDGLDDNVELKFSIEDLSYPLTKELYEISIYPSSDPTKIDSDDDGLYDGQRVVYDINNSKPLLIKDGYRESDLADSSKYKIMIPIDDKPLVVSDFADAWKAQMKSMENGTIATEYSDDRGSDNGIMEELADDADFWVDFLLKNDGLVNEDFIDSIEFMFKDSAQGSTAEEWGSDFLDFILDNKGIAYHSQVDTWQRAFGYNDLYDEVFEYGSNMLVNKIAFSYNNEEYILWSWKGDYWNLQSGGETGIYVYNRHVGKTDHYDVAGFNMPMTLSLYKGSGSQMESIFNWAYTEEQWWVTGFNPEFTEPDPYEMTMICSVDFLNNDLYEAFKETRKKHNEQIVFDDDYHTAWIMW